jgi:hypothetical protein
MASPTVTWKRGSTFAAQVTYTPGAGDPATLEGVLVECSVMDHARQRYPLTVTMLPGFLSFNVYFDGDSSDWAVGTAALDYRCTLDNVVFYSTTARFTIEAQITL